MDIDNTAAQQAIGMMLAAIQIRLEEAARIARAATACAEAGSINEGIMLALDIEQSIHEANRRLTQRASSTRSSASKRIFVGRSPREVPMA